MIYVELPDTEVRRLPFYLAMEEYLARNVAGETDLFFMWQVDPTVIFGRNQIIDNEVNIDYCRRNGIAMCRRKSGGGCVFANRDNIMMSYITANDQFARRSAAIRVWSRVCCENWVLTLRTRRATIY